MLGSHNRNGSPNSNSEQQVLSEEAEICSCGMLKMGPRALVPRVYILLGILMDSSWSLIPTAERYNTRPSLAMVYANGPQGGGIRGFMNDGSLDYKNYHSVDSLAFGHCDYSYRNLGRPSKLQIRQEGNTFEVIIDDKLCISTDKVPKLLDSQTVWIYC